MAEKLVGSRKGPSGKQEESQPIRGNIEGNNYGLHESEAADGRQQFQNTEERFL